MPSRLNRSSPPRPTSAAFSSLTAAWPSKRPSLRDASHTLPMPPWPIGDTSVYAPSVTPASVGALRAGGARESPPRTARAAVEQRLDVGGEVRVLAPQPSRQVALLGREIEHSIECGLPLPAGAVDGHVGISVDQRSRDRKRVETRHHPDSVRLRRRLVQVDARLLPVALHGALRHAPHRRNLREREAAEELEVDDCARAGVDRGELVERVADGVSSATSGRLSAISVSSVISNWPPRFCACRLRA